MALIIMNARIHITVGPVLYYWSRKTLIEFYGALADSPVDTVVLGEVVCSRRHEMKLEDWLALAQQLRDCGKEVVLASQALLESESDLRDMRRLTAQQEFLVEAGDASALRGLAGRPFVLGPHINVYSRPALVEHAALGAARWVAPVELGLDAIALVNPPDAPVPGGLDGDTPIATEVFAFGRLPLAFSARCFTARHYHLNKDDCGFRCIEHPDGLLLTTTEGTPFLTLNGIQTQSAAQHCLIGEAAALRAAGATRVRLSPIAQGFDRVVACFDQVLNHDGDVGEARAALEALSLPGGLVDGFAHRRPGLERSWT
ncbi:MAG: U32 family peptidase [Burkholderiaceae bacterium]|nr:U32 family peptidase [Burkholderiaceae bacterium]